MKNRIVLLAATAITTLFITQARADYRAVGSDGIAASPKVRLALNEQAQAAPQAKAMNAASCCRSTAAKTTTTSSKCCGQCCQQTAKQSQPAPSK